MLVSVSSKEISLPPGSEIIFHDQSWSDYDNLLKMRNEKVYPKIYFNNYTGEIVLMSPLHIYGKGIENIIDLIKAMLRFKEKDWHSFDHLTLKKSQQVAVEPDSCFYIDNWKAILCQEKIDLSKLPPPDLAIEVDFTSITKIDYYLPLAIPELWIYKRGELLIYIYENEAYKLSENSLIFAEFPVKNLVPEYVEFAWENGSSIAIRKFENYLKENYLKENYLRENYSN